MKTTMRHFFLLLGATLSGVASYGCNATADPKIEIIIPEGLAYFSNSDLSSNANFSVEKAKIYSSEGIVFFKQGTITNSTVVKIRKRKGIRSKSPCRSSKKEQRQIKKIKDSDRADQVKCFPFSNKQQGDKQLTPCLASVLSSSISKKAGLPNFAHFNAEDGSALGFKISNRALKTAEYASTACLQHTEGRKIYCRPPPKLS